MAPAWCKACFGLAAACFVLGITSQDGGADPRRAKLDRGVVGYVVAESDFGNRTVVGPVRRARLGYEVRLPGGTWVDCRLDCAEALRVESIDFWETHGRNGVAGHRLLGLKWYRYY
jgi:hypothetical protein